MILKNALIICTDDKWENLTEIFLSLHSQYLPQTIIIASSSEASKELTELVYSLFPKYETHFMAVAGGLVEKRKQAFEKVSESAEFVHFIDDDFFPGRNYFVHISEKLQSSEAILGVGSFFRQEMNHPSYHSFRKFFMLDSEQKGTILASGFTTNAQAIASSEKFPTEYQSVEWLSGCSMSYKTSALQKIRFPTELEGYCMDEDLIISDQVRNIGELLLIPIVGSEHRSQKKEFADLEFRAMALNARRHFVSKYFEGRFKMLAFRWATLGVIVSLSRHWWKNPGKIVHFFRLIL